LPKDQPFDFTACTGDVLDDIDGQIAKLIGRKFDVLTVTIGGNDFGFEEIAVCDHYPIASQILTVHYRSLVPTQKLSQVSTPKQSVTPP
jgi:hypothetical protein